MAAAARARQDGEPGRTALRPGRVLSEGDPGFDRYWPAFRRQSDHVERSRSLDEPPTGPIVVIEADRIVSTEHRLRREGFAPRRFWTRADN